MTCGKQRPRTTILNKFAEEVVTTISIKSNFACLIFTFSLNDALEDAIYGKFLQKFITQWNPIIGRGFSMLSILRDDIETFLLTFPILSSLLDDTKLYIRLKIWRSLPLSVCLYDASD